jgi:hypothetical protein
MMAIIDREYLAAQRILATTDHFDFRTTGRAAIPLTVNEKGGMADASGSDF